MCHSCSVVCPAGVLQQNTEGRPLLESDLNDGKAVGGHLCHQSVTIASFSFSSMCSLILLNALKNVGSLSREFSV